MKTTKGRSDQIYKTELEASNVCGIYVIRIYSYMMTIREFMDHVWWFDGIKLSMSIFDQALPRYNSHAETLRSLIYVWKYIKGEALSKFIIQ